jgi:transmembrane sensor
MQPRSRPDDRASSEAQAWHARLRGEPGPGDRRAFERWYAEDPANRDAYDRIDADWDARYGLLARTAAGLSRTGLPVRRSRNRPVGYALAAASLAALLLGGLLLLRPGTEPAAQAELVSTAIGEIRTIRLPDRSTVTLDTATRLAVRFDERERRVELQQGRARFSVRPSPDRPFIVKAAGAAVVAGGDVFDVSLDQASAAVVLIEGEIGVAPARSDAAERTMLRAGDRVLLHPEGRLEVVASASEAELRWPSGMLEFLNTPLAAAVAEANRYSRRHIRIGDPAIAKLRVTGTYRAGDTAGLARSLAAAFAIIADDSRPGEILLRPAE